MNRGGMRQALVIGGGIGGLAAALCLRRAGWRVEVLEQAQELREVGAGIQISPNGFRVLEGLGLADALRGTCPRADAVVLRDYRAGRPVVRLDMAQAEPGYHFVHRADLVDLLARAGSEQGVGIRLDAQVAEVQPGQPPRVRLAGGEVLCADLVVGADGLHSVLRPVLNGQVAPFFTGQVAWRAIVPNVVAHPAEAWVHMGPGRHLVSYPLRDRKLINLVAVEERRDWVPEGWSHRDESGGLQRSFAGFGGVAAQMIAAAERPGLWGLFRHPVAERWQGEGVVLLGDAAHPTLPFLAQGANMALEDAWILATALAEDLSGGLARYQAVRRERVARVIAAANGNAWKYHLRNPLVRGVAHMGLAMMGRVAPAALVGQFDWLYEYDARSVT